MSQQSKTLHELISIRDTVESIWVAIILAFVLRAFVLEAFVIPTGSMAPRLYGEHVELRCPACGYEFAYGKPPSGRSVQAICPSCGYDAFQKSEYISGGDRVLVMKYLYRFQDPRPWDVVVFKNPQDNQENYIKRLIGLPGETIEIVHGDIFVRQEGSDEFLIRRKTDPKVQGAMWQEVFNNDYRPLQNVIDQANLARSQKIVPPQWGPADPLSDLDAKWHVEPNAPASHYGRIFRFDGTDDGREATLALEASNPQRMYLPRYGYNPGIEPGRPDICKDVDIVSDLKLEGAWHPSSPESKLLLGLSSFEFLFRAEIAGDGAVRLLCRRSDDPADAWRPLAPPAKIDPLADGRGHVVSLRHVDLSASVWVDGRQVATSVGQEAGEAVIAYPMDYRWIKNRLTQARQDLGARPVPVPAVTIAASGPKAAIEHVTLMRDVYYTTPKVGPGSIETGSEFSFLQNCGVEIPQNGRPGWGTEGSPITLGKFENRDLDQFFVLGDNSPESLDGRLWVKAAASLKLYETNGRDGDPNLTIGDLDWKKFLQMLQRPTTSDTSSAAAYVRSRLSPEIRNEVQRLTASQVSNDSVAESLKRDVVSQLNRMIASPDFFDRMIWLRWGATLPPAAQALAERSKELSSRDLRRLNRLAIQAAFPQSVSDRWRVYQLGTVPRYGLIGKAIFVYWPSGFRVPGAESLPIIPNVGRMRLIR
jgi:signal peptidase I